MPAPRKRPPAATSGVHVQARVPQHLADAIEALCRKNGLRTSDVIRDALEHYFSGKTSPRTSTEGYLRAVHEGHVVARALLTAARRALPDEPAHARAVVEEILRNEYGNSKADDADE